MSQERLNHIMLMNVHQKKEVYPEMHLGISKVVEVDPDNYRRQLMVPKKPSSKKFLGTPGFKKLNTALGIWRYLLSEFCALLCRSLSQLHWKAGK